MKLLARFVLPLMGSLILFALALSPLVDRLVGWSVDTAELWQRFYPYGFAHMLPLRRESKRNSATPSLASYP